MSNFVNDEKVLQIVADSEKNISLVDDYIFALNNSADIVREICMKARFFLPYIDSSLSLTLDSVWNADENMRVIQSIDLLELEIDNLRDCLLELIGINTDIENTFEQIQQYRRNIEAVFLDNDNTNFEKKEDYMSPVIEKEDVVDAIERNFSSNRDITNDFSNEVYRQLYNDISNGSFYNGGSQL